MSSLSTLQDSKIEIAKPEIVTQYAFENYYTSILDGKIIGCEKLKRASELILETLYNPKEFHYDDRIAQQHVGFIEKYCRIPSGKLGAKFNLELFQRALLEVIFGFVDDDDLRQYQEVLEIIGRKNAKTTLAAAVEMDMLFNDLEGSPQIYNIATKREQALLGYRACVKMRALSPELSAHSRKRQSDIYFPQNFGYIQALASNTSGLDGLDTHCGVIDELAAIKDRDLYDLIKQSMYARKQPLLLEISTNGYHRNGIFDAQYKYAEDVLYGVINDKRFLPIIYELDSEEEMLNPKMWIKANPGLGTIKSFEKLKDNVQKALDDPSFKPTVLVKDFNIKQNNAAAWLSWEAIENTELWDTAEFDYCIGGFDAADSVDLNAAKAVCMRPNDNKIYVKQMYWLPEDVVEKDTSTRRERDNAPYRLWKEQGLLRTYPGNKVEKRVFLDWFIELRDKEGLQPLFIGYDPWHITEELLALFKMEFGENCMIPIRQGSKTLSEPMKNLKADLEANRIIYNNNPIDKWCMLNTTIKEDINGNIQPIKGRDKRLRIDGTVALICAYIVLMNNLDLYINLNKELK